jgi:CRP-like cAMP-binding protein
MSEEAADLRVLTRLELYFSTRHTLRTMRLFADLFGNDYDLVIIFLAVAEVGLQAVFHLAAINPETVEIKDLYERLGSAGLSIFSIAEATGIPRETVRRKVHQLVSKGFLGVRDKDKNIYLPASALSNPEMLGIMNLYVNEIATLVRTIQFYSSSSPT